MAGENFPVSYKDPAYDAIDADVTARLGLPAGLLSAIRTHGERSNADQVSEASARTPYQVIPATRVAAVKKYGIDAYLSPENAAEVAGRLLKDSLARNKDDVEQAVGEYVGGTNRENWGKTTNSYIQRVTAGMQPAKESAMGADFAKWMAANPAEPPVAAAPVATEKPLDQSFAAWMNQKRAGPDSIPVEPGANTTPTKTPDPSLGQQIVGAGEAGLNAVTGMTGGAAGMVGGAIGGLAGAVASGKFGTQEGAQGIEDAAAQGADALTYSPRTPAGQSQAQALGGALQQAIPLMPLGAEVGMAGRAAEVAAPAVADAGRAAAGAAVDASKAAVHPIIAKAAELLGKQPEDLVHTPVGPRTVDSFAADIANGKRMTSSEDVQFYQNNAAAIEAQLQAMRAGGGKPTPGTMGSVGAAGTDIATLRRQSAQELPVPIDLTKGQATRDFEQQRFETEMSKDPTKGQALRDRAAQQHDQVWKNFDQWLDETGAQKTNAGEVGDSVKQAITERAQADKNRVRSAYKSAENAGELEQPVALTDAVNYLNENAPDAAVAKVLEAARARALKLGVAVDDGSGNLVAQPVPLKKAELFRRAVSNATDYEPTNQFHSGQIKGLVDQATEGMGGDLYRQARGLRSRYAQNYENIGLVYDLMNNKRGMRDSKVAAEDVFRRSILNGKMEEVKQLRRILQTGGENGQQAWKELQGATLRHIRDEAAKNISRNDRGQEMVSPAGLNSAITSLDKTGKLDFIFGKKGSEQLRSLNDLAKVLFTSPPGAVNHSNTASVILAALDMATSGIAGMPMPVMSGLRILTTHVKDRKIQHRINDALGIKPQPKTVKAPVSVVPRHIPDTSRAPESRTVH